MNHDLIVLMGVSGCGKTTLGRTLEERSGWPFLEGDDFHPPENKEKMGAGIPLTDDDRWPWFDRLREEAKSAIEKSPEGKPVTLACSALKREYRDYLLRDFKNPLIIFIRGSKETILGHVNDREHEYMPPSLLDSQFETLEEPGEDENPLIVEIEDGIETAIERLTDL
ncbi:MAG: gluconokinase [Verrucomicrobiales bacterium]|nr:gluconokinase [Verrucomicrobiales bacterium]